MQKYLLSVILPVYNGLPFLSEAIRSLLSQSFQDFKILVIDNGSTDGTSEFIYELKNENIKYFRLNEPDLVKALNKGIELSETQFTARMDSDDISHPKRFEKQINYLLENQEIDIVGTNGYYISSNGLRQVKINLPLRHDKIIHAMLKKRSAIIHGSAMFRTEVFNSNNFYDARYFPCEDYKLFLRVGDRFKFANIKEHLYFFRVRENSIMSTHIKDSIKIYYSINRKYENKYYNLKENMEIESNSKLRTFEKIDVFSVSIYRRGLYYFLNVNSILGIIYFIIASIMNPLRFFYSVKRKIFSPK